MNEKETITKISANLTENMVLIDGLAETEKVFTDSKRMEVIKKIQKDIEHSLATLGEYHNLLAEE